MTQYLPRALAAAALGGLVGVVVTCLLLITRDVDRIADTPAPTATVTVTSPPTLLPDEEDAP